LQATPWMNTFALSTGLVQQDGRMRLRLVNWPTGGAPWSRLQPRRGDGSRRPTRRETGNLPSGAEVRRADRTDLRSHAGLGCTTPGTRRLTPGRAPRVVSAPPPLLSGRAGHMATYRAGRCTRIHPSGVYRERARAGGRRQRRGLMMRCRQARGGSWPCLSTTPVHPASWVRHPGPAKLGRVGCPVAAPDRARAGMCRARSERRGIQHIDCRDW
jgi:hypothetical protein